MISVNSIIFERINSVIAKKWHKGECSNPGTSNDQLDIEGSKGLTEKNFLSHSKYTVSIEKIEHKIEDLENQNDQLLYFINFLFENLPDLILSVLRSVENNESNPEPAGIDNNALLNKSPIRCKNEPCPTRREKEVLELLGKGLCAKEIAKLLFISETTVVTHKKNLKEKFNARNSLELLSKSRLQNGK